MKKILIIIVVLVTLTITILFGWLLYVGRDQHIDFSTMLPKSFNVCGEQIDKQDSRYIALQDWLRSNQYPWNNYVVISPDGYFFRGEDMTVIIRKDAVFVRYRDGNSTALVGRKGETTAIYATCENSSEYEY